MRLLFFTVTKQEHITGKTNTRQEQYTQRVQNKDNTHIIIIIINEITVKNTGTKYLRHKATR